MQVRVLSGVPIIAAIAQLAERLICNQDVRGSIPRGGTNTMEKRAVEVVRSAWKAERGSDTMGFEFPLLRQNNC